MTSILISVVALLFANSVSVNAQKNGSNAASAQNYKVQKYDTKVQLGKAYAHYREGAYLQALEELDKIVFVDANTKGLIAYWRGRCYTHLNRYNEAIPELLNAKTLATNFEDTHYLLGQSYYAIQELQLAREQFRLSQKQNYKPNVSLYYIGYSSQILGDFAQAKQSYLEVLAANSDPADVKPVVRYQLAELYFERAERITDKAKRNAFVRKHVVPLFEKTVEQYPNSSAAIQARARLEEIMGVENRYVEKMRNGVPISRKKYRLELSQDIGYDTNVTTEGDDSSVSSTNKSSLYSRTSAYYRYQYNLRKTWSFLPEANFFYKRHFNRVANVIANDEISLKPGVQVRFEHWLGKHPGTLLFDVNYERSWKDVNSTSSLSFYDDNIVLSVGERSTLLGGGSSTFKFGITVTDSVTSGSDASSPFLSFSHNFPILGNYSMNLFFKAEFFRFDNSTSDSDDFSLRANLNMTKLFPKIDFNPALLITVRDTKLQSSTRGTELLLNPSLTFLREMTSWLDGQFVLSYSRQLSKDKTSRQYSQLISTIGFTAKM